MECYGTVADRVDQEPEKSGNGSSVVEEGKLEVRGNASVESLFTLVEVQQVFFSDHATSLQLPSLPFSGM